MKYHSPAAIDMRDTADIILQTVAIVLDFILLLVFMDRKSFSSVYIVCQIKTPRQDYPARSLLCPFRKQLLFFDSAGYTGIIIYLLIANIVIINE